MAKDGDIIDAMFSGMINLFGWIFKNLLNLGVWIIGGILTFLWAGGKKIFYSIKNRSNTVEE